MINSVNIGNFSLHFYSLCILLGVIFAYLIIMKESKKQKINPDVMFNIIFWGLLLGIIGARLYYVLFNFEYYVFHMDEIIKVWNGGLAIHGGIIVGLIVVYFYSIKRNLSFLKLTDIIIPGVILAQAFGRWGNFFNQEAFGMMVSKELLQKLLVPNFVIKGMYIDGAYFLPTFYFESILCLIGFIIMLIIRNKTKKSGYVTAFYLIWYGLVRFIIEYYRTDSLMLFNAKVAMIVSGLMFIFGILLIVYIKRYRNIRSKE